MATYLARRWRPPSWLELEEIMQELMIGAWSAIWKWDPRRAGPGQTLGSFVEWNAMDKAKKRLHKARGAKLSGNADANPGHSEIPLCMFDATPGWVEGLSCVEPTQLVDLERVQDLVRAHAVCVDDRERIVLKFIAEMGDLVEGAAALYEDKQAREFCGVMHERDAAHVAVEVAVAINERLAMKAA